MVFVLPFSVDDIFSFLFFFFFSFPPSVTVLIVCTRVCSENLPEGQLLRVSFVFGFLDVTCHCDGSKGASSDRCLEQSPVWVLSFLSREFPLSSAF